MPAIRPHTQKPANRRKDLLDEQSSATQARVTFDDPTFRFANTEFFSVLLGGEDGACSPGDWRVCVLGGKTAAEGERLGVVG